MRFFKLPFYLSGLLLALAFIPSLLRAENPPARKIIERAADLPVHTYKLTLPPSALLADDAAFRVFAARVKEDILSDLDVYDVRDRRALQRYLSTLLSVALLDHDVGAAQKLIADLRTLETEPSLKLTSGLVAEAWSKATAQHVSPDTFPETFRAELSALLARLSWNVVKDDVEKLRAVYEVRSEEALRALAREQFDSDAFTTGQISGDVAGQLLGMRNQIVNFLPYKTAILSAFGSTLNAHTSGADADVWTPNLVKMSRWSRGKPVLIGIWDSGADIKVFKKNLYTGEDGAHGFAYDLHSDPSTELLLPLDELKEPRDEMIDRLKGFGDIQAGIGSADAIKLKQFLGTLKKAQRAPMLEQLILVNNWAHGTFVTGIAIAGNPHARVMIGRITYDYHFAPEIPTLEQTRKDAAATQAMVDAFKKAGVRVVNLSWGGSLNDVEGTLKASGAPGTAEEQKKLARQLFQIASNGLLAAMKSAPEILFVTAAGKDDGSAPFDDFFPSSFQLPNMITVGAVDQSGAETPFSSFGLMVNVHANGSEVASVIPDGKTLTLSGASFAVPQVTNLAGKLFSLAPELTPEETRKIILDGCEKIGRANLINPAKSVALLKERLSEK